MTTVTFEEVTEQHLPEIRVIYNYYVMKTTISFHTEELDLDQIKSSVMNKDTRYKTYVILENNQMMGYVLITQYKSKQAYDICGEVTIYLKPDILGKGLGNKHYVLLRRLQKNKDSIP